MLRKIRTKKLSDRKLKQLCETEIGKDCSIPEWHDLPDLYSTEPPKHTVAVLFDMRNTDGVIYIHESNDDYVDAVGSESKGNIIIIPWTTGLTFRCYGLCRIGYLMEST
ncbi:hypothetical protein CCUS01_06559 [Colletotrichum cuscutae]|uniref:Uncharacterized protein n=1 Tax=Colletotrichum cuscutae TaxID=1209917 RepID=A0AAI9V479_9PEZI|nr:hypothetical protein CCUS01_06559 [Colletotrichum cuscutae]